jgi:hypothetical protein
MSSGTRIIVQVMMFKAERSHRRHLRDVLAGFRQIKCQVSPGRTMTLPGGNAIILLPSNSALRLALGRYDSAERAAGQFS